MKTDYLVVGAGATGLAFADALAAEADVHVTVVDRAASAGGHWAFAYPFLRLHTPSAYYGANSLALGQDRVDAEGENAGFYERATGGEVFEYFGEVAARLEATGRVRVLLGHEHVAADGEGEHVSEVATGRVLSVAVRRGVVDARYLEASIPATHTPSFEVGGGAPLVPVNALPVAAEGFRWFTVLGGGKTAADACNWLLDHGVSPDRIRWVRPRDAWFYDRRHFQPGAQVGSVMEGLALDAEAAASASSLADLFERLEASGRLVRIDPRQPATMYRGTMLSTRELAALRQIEDVVRLGRVRRVEARRVVLERGEVPVVADGLVVDCTARGLNPAPAVPIFQPGRIVLQQVRYLSPCFNAALIAFVEAHRDDDAGKNRLCPPNPFPSTVEDWPRMRSRTWRSEGRWLGEPDISEWVGRSRLNLMRDLPEHAAEPPVQEAVTRYLANVTPAIERLKDLEGSARPA